MKKLPDGVALLSWNSELPSSGTGDPLGMTLRVGARLAAELMHCITSVTPRARYYAFYPWAFQRAHDRAGNDATFAHAMRHVLIDERAMTLGAVLHHDGRPCEGGALQGSNQAVRFAANPSGSSIDLVNWNHLDGTTTGFGPYKGSLINLGLFEEGPLAAGDDEGDEASTVLETGKLSEKGRLLAEAFDRAVSSTQFARLGPDSAVFDLEMLAEFGAAAGLCELVDADAYDLTPLRDLFFASDIEDTHNSHYRRRMSLLLMLWAVDTTSAVGVDLDAAILDDLVCYGCVFDEHDNADPVNVPPALIDITQRWRIFHFHNHLTTALESLLAGLLRVIRNHPAGLLVGEIVAAFDRPEANAALVDQLEIELTIPFMDHTPAEALALLGIDASGWKRTNTSLVFEQNPFVERCLRKALVDDGNVSGPAGPAIAALLLFSLLLRFECDVDDAYKGWNRHKVFQPFSDVSMPTVIEGLVTELGNAWWNRPCREVVSRILSRFVVRQHETMSYEKGFGGSPALFRVDGAMIIGADLVHDKVSAGNARFPSALQVLKDLRLVIDDPDAGRVLTRDGSERLADLLREAAA